MERGPNRGLRPWAGLLTVGVAPDRPIAAAKPERVVGSPPGVAWGTLRDRHRRLDGTGTIDANVVEPSPSWGERRRGSPGADPWRGGSRRSGAQGRESMGVALESVSRSRFWARGVAGVEGDNG